MELYDVLRTTGAVREFTDEPVTDADLFTILDNARFAPSGGNRQGAHVTVVRSAATKERLAELCGTGARRYAAQVRAGEAPWNTVNPTSVTPEEVAATAVPESLSRPIAAAPVVLVVTVDLAVVASLDADLDRIGVVSGGSIYPLVWNILLSARHEGFGGTITTMAVAEEPAVRALLGIPEGHAVAAVVPLGRPVRQVTRLRRHEVADFVTRERFNGPPLDA